MKKITPFLWFDTQAEEAMNFYVSLFGNSEILDVSRNGDRVQSVRFRLEDQEFTGFNAGPAYQFTEAISFFVDCKDQAEVDTLWAKLSEEGKEGECGWIKDKFGLSWQIVPDLLGKLLSDPDPARAGRTVQAMLQMKKLDSVALQRAYDGE